MKNINGISIGQKNFVLLNFVKSLETIKENKEITDFINNLLITMMNK